MPGSSNRSSAADSTTLSATCGTSLGAIVTIGFAASVVMWSTWFITHLPALALPIDAAGPILLVLLILVIGLGVARGGVPRRSAWLVGLGAGILSGCINLAILGSKIVKPAEGASPGSESPGTAGLVPNAAFIVAGFIALCAVIGLIGGLIGGVWGAARTPMPTTPDARRWLSRFAVVAAVSIAPILLIGGLVTSTQSGLSVPDWPGTYGGNMFLYPVALMAEPRVFFEHSHRLFGTLVGMTMIALFAFTFAVDRRAWARGWAGLLLVLVIVQGILGGLRVTEMSQWLAVFHGVLAQLFFALTVAFAGVQSGAFRRLRVIDQPSPSDSWSTPPVANVARTIAALALISIVLQLVMGAMYRHTHSPHALWAHVGFSIVVVVLAVATGATLMARRQIDGVSADIRGLHSRLYRIGYATMIIVALQFMLGWAVLFTVLSADPATKAIPTASELAAATPIAAFPALLRTVHQANGAALLALATLCAVWVLRLSIRRRETSHSPVPAVVAA